MFRSCKFPYVGNAQHISGSHIFHIFVHVPKGISQAFVALFAAFLSQQARDDWHLKLSDFNLLIHLPAVIGLPVRFFIMLDFFLSCSNHHNRLIELMS